MEIAIISAVAFLGSMLTFFSGFGLGTLLLPVFALFFPVEVAIALTGGVHLLNNLFKMTLVGRHAVWKVVLRFGVPAIIGALIGASLLMQVAASTPLFSYTIGTHLCEVTLVKLVVALLMFFFALIEILPFYKKLEFADNKLILGGALSGFFGGLSGHQGALRSAFLIKCGLTKEQFIATGVMIASVIDISRISIYFTRFSKIGIEENAFLLIAAVGSAFVGAIAGKKLLKKITIEFLHVSVSVLIMLLSGIIGLGIL